MNIVQTKSVYPKIVMFTGGTGCRTLAKEFNRRNFYTSHIINTTDSGRSTREIRMLFDIPAIGDIRSRLIDLSKETDQNSEILKLLKYRFPTKKELTDIELENELNQIIDGTHPLVKKIEENPSAPKEFTKIIKKNIEYFQIKRKEYESRKNKSFNLESASVGNLFLTGAYLFYQDLEVPIYLYKQLVNVNGDVIAATLDNIHLAAKMQDNSFVVGQHIITKSENGPPKEIYFLSKESKDAQKVEPKLNPKVLKPLMEADLIIYGMGSFYTSILSTLKISGIAEAIRKSKAKKVLLANPTEDAETREMTVGSIGYELLKILKEQDSLPGKDIDYLQFVLSHRIQFPFSQMGKKFIPSNKEPLSSEIKHLKTNEILMLNTPKQEDFGYYNSEKLADIIITFFT